MPAQIDGSIPYPTSFDAARGIAPSELIAATFARIRALNPQLNAYLEVFEAEKHARVETAKASSSISNTQYPTPSHSQPLSGLPIAVKDLFDVAGHRTSAGSSFHADHIAREDAVVVAKLRAAGAVLTGKTNLHEWALGVTNNNPHFGACRNPWDLQRVPGGSSGGSAAALAAGLCLGALGTDTGGSIRIPAALCGVVGLKPTRGRVSLRGVVPLSWSHDHAGPMARTVRDAARLLQVIAGYDRLDPASVDAPVPDYLAGLDDMDLKRVRLGVPTSFFFEESDEEVGRLVHAAIDVLHSLGATIVEVDLPEAADMSDHLRVILLADAAAYHRERIESHPEKFGADVLTRLSAGRGFSAADYALARQARREWRGRLRQAFASVDALLTPTTPLTATLIDDTEGVAAAARLTRFTALFNFAGTPALSVPCGLVSSGLPVGMQIVGRWWEEEMILGIAHAYEQATEWHTRWPPL